MSEMTYLERQIVAIGKRPDLFPRGTLTHFTIEHDDWCRVLVQHLPPCDCKPNIWFKTESGDFYEVTNTGHVVKTGPRICRCDLCSGEE